MKIVSADITGSFILNNVNVTTTVESSSIWSGSIAQRVTDLESWSSSLDTTYATDASVTASILVLSQSVQASEFALSSSFVTNSGSFSTRITSLESASSSFAVQSASLSTRVTNEEATGSVLTSASASFAITSGSQSTRTTNLESTASVLTTASASFAVVSSSYASASGSLSTRVTNLESTSSTVSSSFASTSASLSGRVTIIEGQDATTGSNTFTGPQYINNVSNAIGFASTASLYTDGGLRVTRDSFVSGTAYFNNVVVYGTSSIQYITSSQLNIGTNIINLNTDTPAVRFGGIAVADSGSNFGITGSLLWDSQNNRWIYSNPSGSTYDGGMLISGPRNTTGLGNEVGTTSCAVMIGQGGDHITSSGIFSYANATCFYGTSLISGSGLACFSGTVCAPYFVSSGCVQVSNHYLIANVGGNIAGAGGAVNWIGIRNDDNCFVINAITAGANKNNVGIGTTCPCSYGHGGTNRALEIHNSGSAANSQAHVILSTGAATSGGAIGSLSFAVPNSSDSNKLGSYIGADIEADSSTVVCTNLGFATRQGGVAPQIRLRISSAGIASFACQVCTAGLVSNGATTICGAGTSLSLNSTDGTPVRLKILRSTVPTYLTDIYTAATTAGSSWSINKADTSAGSSTWAGSDNTSYSTSAIRLVSTTGASSIEFYTAAAANTNPTLRALIDGSGIACFQNTVCTPLLKWGSSSVNVASTNDASGVYLEVAGTTTATRRLRLQGVNDAGNKYSQFFINAGAGEFCFVTEDAQRLLIGNTGIATFACQVCAPYAIFSGTGALTIPTGTTAQRPTGTAGMIRMNTTTGQPEWYNTATSTWAAFNQNTNSYLVEYLVVGGGGAGGYDNGGGGGAGGFVLDCGLAVTSCMSYSVVVGAGGSATTGVSGNGGASCFNGIVALGGGGAGGQSNIGNDGGSGGGTMYYPFNTPARGGFGTIGQGFEGGCWLSESSPYIGSGGGGACQRGFDGPANGMGGSGRISTLLGNTCFYAGGGNGSGDGPGCQVQSCGGGGIAGNPTGGNGNANSGGGGGGGINGGNFGGNGGSGIVIIRYPGCQRGSGGTICKYCGTTIHVFLSSGTFVA